MHSARSDPFLFLTGAFEMGDPKYTFGTKQDLTPSLTFIRSDADESRQRLPRLFRASLIGSCRSALVWGHFDIVHTVPVSGSSGRGRNVHFLNVQGAGECPPTLRDTPPVPPAVRMVFEPQLNGHVLLHFDLRQIKIRQRSVSLHHHR